MTMTHAQRHGFLNVFKPKGMNSHTGVAIARKLFDTQRIGHAGTLDPMATGVLVLAIGRATRFLQYMTSDKAYDGVIRFGVTTDTDDITGKVLTERPVPWLRESDVANALPRFVGAIDQVPPKVSALKQGGQRLYKLVRSKQEVNVPARRVIIDSIDLLDFLPGDFPEVSPDIEQAMDGSQLTSCFLHTQQAKIHVECGGGTYIRSIARECGEVLQHPDSLDSSSIGGTLAELTRTRSGTFTIADSVTFEEVREQMQVNADQSVNGLGIGKPTPLVPIEAALLHLPSITLSAIGQKRWLGFSNVIVRPQDMMPPGGAPLDQVCDPQPGDALRVYSDDATPVFLGLSIVYWCPKRSRLELRKRLILDLD
ncbi:TPA: hypothetical protein N0F65_011565 [Lagenidium giganteum]|uniref:tRNA pseudouridine(55) synthase n=1 Tax=Lagenidium giganteum TaxID=4803 RepID=A0AAV2YN40_9STRA|nr:TPA: hypothetical protein N0F65_011565 [Lagenidium giganteum]